MDILHIFQLYLDCRSHIRILLGILLLYCLRYAYIGSSDVKATTQTHQYGYAKQSGRIQAVSCLLLSFLSSSSAVKSSMLSVSLIMGSSFVLPDRLLISQLETAVLSLKTSVSSFGAGRFELQLLFPKSHRKS